MKYFQCGSKDVVEYLKILTAEQIEEINKKFEAGECNVIDQAIILKNSVKCNKCGDIIISEGNDKIFCRCKNVGISGGKNYLLREGNDYSEMTQYFLND